MYNSIHNIVVIISAKKALCVGGYHGGGPPVTENSLFGLTIPGSADCQTKYEQ